jgi:hypothetical protein
MISFCVTSKDRCSLFANCVQSLASSVDVPAELVVTDWASRSRLSWLPAVSNLPYTLVQLPAGEPFSRGRGLNTAARYARYPILFFIDTDMLFCSAVVRQAITIAQSGAAYFPICWSYTKPDHSAGRWRDNGKGIVALCRKKYELAQQWDEYQQWGSEDVNFYERVSRYARIDRIRTTGLYHQWHVPSCSTDAMGRRPARTSTR